MSKLSPKDQVDRVRRQSLTTVVQDALEEMIIGGQIEPGQHMNENALATTLGVSRGPVREACRSLEALGLLEMKPNRGFFVIELDKAAAAQIYETRAGTFGYACMLAAERATPAQIARLESMVDHMNQLSSEVAIPDYVETNREFHAYLLEMAGNDRLTRLHADLFRETNLFRQKALRSAEALRVSNEEHAALFEAVRTGDPDRAFQIARAHVEAGRNRHLEGA